MTDSHEGEGSALTADDLRRLGLNPRSQPAYLIEGEVFDFYGPTTGKPQLIRDRLRRMVERGLAYRFVVHLGDSRVTVEELQAVLRADPINGLREVIAIDQNGEIGHPFP